MNMLSKQTYTMSSYIVEYPVRSLKDRYLFLSPFTKYLASGHAIVVIVSLSKHLSTSKAYIRNFYLLTIARVKEVTCKIFCSELLKSSLRKNRQV